MPKKQEGVIRVRPARNVLEEDAQPKVHLKAWYTMKLDQDGRLQPHHFESIVIYFKGLGLGEVETPERYERALKVYFGE